MLSIYSLVLQQDFYSAIKMEGKNIKYSQIVF